MDSLSPPFGFAIRRNGSCLLDEVDCGPRAVPYHACCPRGTFCPRDCCPTRENCAETLLQRPACANETWTLYDNDGGFFCCATDKIGYAQTLSDSVGCADPGLPPEGARLLSVVVAGKTAISTSASPSSTASSESISESLSLASTIVPTSSTASPGPTSESKSNTGTIVGGVVGGLGVVVLLVLGILFYRWKSRRSQIPGGDRSTNYQDSNIYQNKPKVATETPREPVELDNTQQFELADRRAMAEAELR